MKKKIKFKPIMIDILGKKIDAGVVMKSLELQKNVLNLEIGQTLTLGFPEGNFIIKRIK